MTTLFRRLPAETALRRLAAAAAMAALLACDSATASDDTNPPNEDLAIEVLATGLKTVWELAWGPDGFIWVTERWGRISRMHPRTGALTTVGQLDVAEAEAAELGLMGLTFHPDFATQPWVYVVHSYEKNGAVNRLVRMRLTGATLGAPQVLLDDIPGSSIHNGSRLTIGPDRLLYMTTGDANDASLPQNRASLAGKVLRLTLEGQPAPGNPFGTAVYSYGHRNPQGMVFTPDGKLFITEHGTEVDDEVNRIEAGGNYGWPNVLGFCDGDIGASETAFCAANTVVEPLERWTPSVAPAALAYYDHPLMPQFSRSLLFGTLKQSTLYRLALSPDFRSVTSTETLFAHQFGRLRAVLVAPDGSIYLGTSNKDGRGIPGPTDDRIIRISPR